MSAFKPDLQRVLADQGYVLNAQLLIGKLADAREPARITADLRVQVRNGDTTWGDFEKLLVIAQLNRPSGRVDTGESELKLQLDEARTPWGRAKSSRCYILWAQSFTNPMPAEVKLQAYQDYAFKGRLREIFPSADRSKSIVEVRVSILDPDARVKPEMSASVTFQEPHKDGAAKTAGPTPVAPVVLIPKRAVTDQGGQSIVWVVTGPTASRRPVTLGPERIDQIEVRSGVAPGEAVILNAPATLTDRARVRVK